MRGSRRVRTLLAATAVTAAALALLPAQAAAAAAAPSAANATKAAAQAAAKGAIGWDAYRRLDRLPEVTSGVATRQYSSFDRTGGNDDGFVGTYSCLRTEADGCVIAEHSGPGEIDSIWFTRDNGDVRNNKFITIELDGKTVLHAPLQDVVDGKLGAPFVYPLVANADESSGGVYVKVPMPFRSSMKVVTDVNSLFNHVTYRTFADDSGVSTFDPKDQATDVVAKLKAAGTKDPKPAQPGARTRTSKVDVAPGKTAVLATDKGPGAVTAMQLKLPQLVGPTAKPIADDGRAFGAGGSSTFTVAVDPDNEGVRLTRRLDTLAGHQKADVYVNGEKAGQWSSGAATGGQWADESIDLPASLTAGKSKLTIENRYVSSDLDFNEFRYTAESKVGGSYTTTDTVDVGNGNPSEAAHDYAIVKPTWFGEHTYSYPPTAADQAKVEPSDDVLQHARVRVTFDGRRLVDSPLGEFFGSGLGFYDVRSLMFGIDTKSKTLSSWWLMPYRSGVKVELYNGSKHAITGGSGSFTTVRQSHWARDLAPGGPDGYFRTQSRDQDVVPGQDYDLLNVTGRGKYVGATHTMTGHIPSGNTREYLEGDERVYPDGSRSPVMHGTGTEDFYESGWYFNRETYTNPMNGNPAHEVSAYGCTYDCTGVYRLMPVEAPAFGSGMRFGIEHGPVDNAAAEYSSTAYWYGQDTLNTRWTDAIDVGDTYREKEHGYSGGGKPTDLTATFEGEDGPQQAVTDDVRASTGAVRFTAKVDRGNEGVVLSRRSDQEKAYQSAAVSVDGKAAGTWLQPLGNVTHRWLDDTFRVPPALTKGKAQVTVTLTPTDGSPAWTAARYDVLSLVTPFTDRQAPGKVFGVKATGGDTGSVALTWKPAADDVLAPSYVVYGSKTKGFKPGQATELGRTNVEGFTHTDGLNTTWYYRVRAVDARGHQGTISDEVSATTGRTLRLEGESLLPAKEADAPVVAQGDCCGVHWSGGAQLWFQATKADQHVTVSFEVPNDGTYDLSAVQTKAGDYGINTLAIDGKQVGDSFDGYGTGVTVTDPISYGSVQLTKGTHELTLTVTGKNASATGYLAGLDHLDLKLSG